MDAFGTPDANDVESFLALSEVISWNPAGIVSLKKSNSSFWQKNVVIFNLIHTVVVEEKTKRELYDLDYNIILTRWNKTVI